MSPTTVKLIAAVLWLVFAYTIGLIKPSDLGVVGGILGMVPLMLAAQYLSVRRK